MLGVRRGWMHCTETNQSFKVQSLLSTMICFGGGVILTSCLTHMLPDVNEVSFSENISTYPTKIFYPQLATAGIEIGTFPDSGLPVAEIFVLTGFLMIYMMEEVVHFLLVKFAHLGNIFC